MDLVKNEDGTFFAGYFDQQFRQSLFISWASHLQEANISFRSDLARVEVSFLQLCFFLQVTIWEVHLE